MGAAHGMIERTDVLVVGGGLIGCAAAWQLAKRGARVVLLEAEEINAGASGQNAGSLHFQVERRFLEGDGELDGPAARIVALNRFAVDDWRGLEAELGADLHVNMEGGLMVAETAEEVSVLERKVRQEQAYGLSSRLLDGEQAREIAPYLGQTIVAASFCEDEGHADPRAVTPAFAAAAEAAGARLRTGTRVTAIGKAGSGFSVTCDDGGSSAGIICEKLLVAAGAWTPQIASLANLHIPLFAVALLMNASERTRPFIPHLVQHVGRRLSMKQADAGNVIIGGGWPSRLALSSGAGHDLDRRATMIEASLRGNLRAAIDTVPAVADLNLIRSWTGTTTIGADQLPIVGEVPRLPGFFVAAGGSAFTLGPTFARLLADAILGSPADLLDIVSPRRFEHLNSFMGLG